MKSEYKYFVSHKLKILYAFVSDGQIHNNYFKIFLPESKKIEKELKFKKFQWKLKIMLNHLK